MKQAKAIRSANIRESFLSDLYCVSDAISKECFDKVVAHFLRKWEAIAEVKVPVENFKKD